MREEGVFICSNLMGVFGEESFIYLVVENRIGL